MRAIWLLVSLQGYHADLMADINKVSRESQDAFAARSHQNAAKAQKAGILAEVFTHSLYLDFQGGTKMKMESFEFLWAQACE